MFMARQFISYELKEKALELSLQGVTDREILEYLGIGKSTMKHVRRNYRRTGDVVRVPICAGRPRLLDAVDTWVSDVQSFQLLFLSF